MKAKIGVLLLASVIASAGMGIGYATVTGGYDIGGFPSCYCDVAFVGTVTARDNEVEKFIGEIDAWLVDVDSDGLYDKVEIEIDHAYPGYVVYIDFTVENKGDRPVNVNGLIPISYDAAAMSFGLDGDITQTSFPWWLEVGSSVDGTLVITVLNGAIENSVYTFTVGLGFSGEDCCPDPDLSNGGFEGPVVTHSKKWDIFGSGTYGLEWTVDWHGGSTTYQGQTRPEPALLELHRGVSGWLPHEGEQYTELDTDWDGPDGGLSGEPASVKISQVVVSCPWRTYTLAFSWSPRPGHADNGLKVYWDGAEIFDSGIVSGVENSNTDWHIETITGLTVTGVSTSIEFVETGTPDSFGMFLDAVSVQLE